MISVALFGTIYAAWLGVALLAQMPAHWRFVRAETSLRATPRLLGALPLPCLGAGTLVAVGLALWASLAAGALRPEARAWAFSAAVPLAALYFAQVVAVPEVRRKASLAPLTLLVLGLAAWVPAEWRPAVEAASVFTLKLLVSQMYFSAGLMKVLTAGVRWADGATLRSKLVHYHLHYGHPLARWLAGDPLRSRILAVAVLVFELTFWLVLPFPALAWVYLPAGILFHAGTAVTMRIHYWIYVLPAYLLFVPRG